MSDNGQTESLTPKMKTDFPSTKTREENNNNASAPDTCLNIPEAPMDTKAGKEVPSLFLRLGSAVFYGAASFLIMVINKNVLTVHRFPSFQVLGIGQMLATISLLSIMKMAGRISYPGLTKDTISKIWPLPLFYIGNMLFGLGGTQELSLPMMVVLRRFTIWMTMMAEIYVLEYKPTRGVKISVFLMILGALVAALNDLAFNLKGYIFVLMNDVCTTANVVYLKKKLDSKDLGKYGLMYYNSLFMIFPTMLMAYIMGDFDKSIEYQHWDNIQFLLQFLLSCIFGFILMLSLIVCNHYNSPLTTMVVGSIKNVLTVYLGMFIGGDYIFSVLNFTGLTLSTVGSLIYSKVTFKSK